MLNVEMKEKNYKVGDQISIALPNHGRFTATAEKVENDKVLFIFDQIVVRRTMNSKDTNVGGFKATELYRWLQEKLLPEFPEELKSGIRELTIPTVGQIVGHEDTWDNEHLESDEDEQLPLMKNQNHRIATFMDEPRAYWLQNASKSEWSAPFFALVYHYGTAHCGSASNSDGVRPEFWLERNTGGLVPRKATQKELENEIESKLREIHSLRSEIKELKKYEEYEKVANELKAFKDSFVQAGFSEKQAFQILLTTLQTTLGNGR